MTEFLDALARYPFLQLSLAGGVAASVACGIVGSYVVVRRISYIAGGIAHCVFGGLGAAEYLRAAWGWQWLEPMYGALAAALLAAVIIGWVSLRARQWEDTIIGALWAIGMAIGVLFVRATPGYAQNLMGYLFGDIQMISKGNLWLIVALDAVVVAAALAFHKQLQLVCFDAEYARTRGLNVEGYYLALLCLTALTVVLLAWVVGIVMVIAMLTIPAAVAGMFVRRLWQMMIVSTALTGAFVTVGFAVSYSPGLPTGATIIVLAGAVYLVAATVRSLARRGR